MTITKHRTWACVAAAFLGAVSAFGATQAQAGTGEKGLFEWRSSAPLITPSNAGAQAYSGLKDSSVV